MTQFRKKPVVIEATQWFENGDHPEDNSVAVMMDRDEPKKLTEGKVVKFFRIKGEKHNALEAPQSDDECKHCCDYMYQHGWIDTLEGGHIVCPGDWIITGVKGERYPCKNDVFQATYEYVNPADDPNVETP